MTAASEEVVKSDTNFAVNLEQARVSAPLSEQRCCVEAVMRARHDDPAGVHGFLSVVDFPT